jgi:hypothetical protein
MPITPKPRHALAAPRLKHDLLVLPDGRAPFRIIAGVIREHADVPHPLALRRATTGHATAPAR